jgi:hypothetical protein
MKNIYTEIIARLTTEVPELKYIDLDKGQLSDFEMRPAVKFPCALIGIQLPLTKDLDQNRTRQSCTALVSIRLAWEFVGKTAAHTKEQQREQSLEYFDLIDKVYEALQGWQDDALTFNKLSRQNLREESSAPYKIIVMPFATAFDTSFDTRDISR